MVSTPFVAHCHQVGWHRPGDLAPPETDGQLRGPPVKIIKTPPRRSSDFRRWAAADRISATRSARHEYETAGRSRELAAIRAKANTFRSVPLTSWDSHSTTTDDEVAAIELARGMAASDVGDATLTRPELAYDAIER